MSYMTSEDVAAAKRIGGTTAEILKIAGEVAEVAGVTLTNLRGSSRRADLCRARELVCFIAQREGFNPQQIATAMLRDPATIRSAIRNEEDRRARLRDAWAEKRGAA